jgi:predicted esterase
MKIKIIVAFLLFNLSVSSPKSQEYQTIQYFTNDSINLSLDLFLPKTPVKSKIPLFIYVHGGGFSAGNRTIGHPICKYLSQNGYAAASISYTLYMKGKNFGCKGILSEKLKTIQIAVNQLWQATQFFIKNQDKYLIDTGKIFIGGSSAGGTTALQAAFWDYSEKNIYKTQLPDTFRYAGVISGAGALLDINLIKKEKTIPVMLWHGTCDVLVPYAKGTHHSCPSNSTGWLLMFGSYSIYNQIIELNENASLTTFCGGTHSYHNKLFETEKPLIKDFMDKVLKGIKIQEHIKIPTGNFCDKVLEYKFCN